MDAPEAILGIQLTEACCTTVVMRNLVKGWVLEVLLNNGLIQILSVKADTKGSTGLSGVGQGRYPLSWPDDWGNDTKCNHAV